jgi:hypothetical protein
MFLIQKCGRKLLSNLFYGEIRSTKLDKIVILPYFPIPIDEVKIKGFVEEISS